MTSQSASRRTEQVTSGLRVDDCQHSADGSTKLRIYTHDDAVLEAVVMRFVRGGAGAQAGEQKPPRYTACLSSQSGCALSCTFCATGQMKLRRSLSVDEIVDQIRLLQQYHPRIDNIVMMGMGEPFHNYDHVIAALYELTNQKTFAIAPRRITISTVGWVPGIKRLTSEPLAVRLALSLHAPDDELRTKLMPVNKRFPLDVLLRTCADYCETTKRKLFVEYLLLEDVNDHRAHAHQLADLLQRYAPKPNFHINLIAYNPTSTPYKGSDSDTVEAFRDILRSKDYAVSYRVSRGRDIDAACGQLANRT